MYEAWSRKWDLLLNVGGIYEYILLDCVAKKDKIYSNRCAVDNEYILHLFTLSVQILRLITFTKAINVGEVLLNNQL